MQLFPWLTAGMPIGVDVGAHAVKLLQLQRRGSALRIVDAQCELLGDEAPAVDQPGYHEAVGAAAHRAYERGAFKGRHIVSCLPSNLMNYRNVRLPPMPKAEMDEAVRWEAADRERAVGEPVLNDYFLSGAVRQGDDAKQEVILMTAAVSQAEAHVEALAAAGLVPVAVDAQPAALSRCLGTRRAGPDVDAEQSRLIVEIGGGSTQVLIDRGDQVLFVKQINIGGKLIDERAAAALGRPVEEVRQLRREIHTVNAADLADPPTVLRDAFGPTVLELGREVQLCLRYFTVTFKHARPTQLMLLGGEAAQPWLSPMLSEAVGLPTMVVDPLEGIEQTGFGERGDVQRVLPGGAGAWAVAAGLSLRPDARIERRFKVRKEAA
jgi:type IV pilus assembly protein PilM